MNRYIIAILLAFVVTAGLFLGMRYLIVGGEGAMTDAPEGRVIDFVRLKKEENTQTKKRKPVKPIWNNDYNSGFYRERTFCRLCCG